MTDQEKNMLNYQRSKGVAKAWERERELVRKGRGARQWTVKEQKELLRTGRVKGYQGHHMKSVAMHPEYAAEPRNIQFLSSRKENNEHLKAHRGDYHNESDGRYNVRTEKTRAMKDGRPRAMNAYELEDKAIEKRGYTKYASEKNTAGIVRTGTDGDRRDARVHVKKSEAKKPVQVQTMEGARVSPEAAARYGKSARSTISINVPKRSGSGQHTAQGSGQSMSVGFGQGSTGGYASRGRALAVTLRAAPAAILRAAPAAALRALRAADPPVPAEAEADKKTLAWPAASAFAAAGLCRA